MRRPELYLALALGTASIAPATAGPAAGTGPDGLHVQFAMVMPAFVQTTGYGGRDTDEIPVHAYAARIARGEPVKDPIGYVVKPAPAGCDRPDRPCPSRRDALSDDRADDLPASFNIEIADEPQSEAVRRELRAAGTFAYGPGPWVTPAAGHAPYEPYGAGTAQVLATDAGKLRPGALAQADCFAGMGLCAVRITYSRDLRVNFLSPGTGEVLARQVQAVDAVMRTVIRPGARPSPQAAGEARKESSPDASPVYFSALPLNRILAKGGFPK